MSSCFFMVSLILQLEGYSSTLRGVNIFLPEIHSQTLYSRSAETGESIPKIYSVNPKLDIAEFYEIG